MSFNYVFSINSGRSGSDYLTELFAQATNAVSVHEGFPIMNGLPMQQFNDGAETALRQLMPLKLQQIQKKRQGAIYCETNHSYIKGWGYLLPDAYIPQEEIAIVMLRREVGQTIQSLLRVHDVPGTSAANRTWYLRPDAPRNLSQPAPDATPYDLCQWYVEEIERRSVAYQGQFPRITYFECDLEQLNDYAFVIHLFEQLGLVPSATLKQVCGRSLNRRDEWPNLSLEELQARSPYPSPDHWPPAERDTLLAAMLAYLQAHWADEIQAIEPDDTMGGTVVLAVTRIVALAEPALETQFQVALKFSETESLLILELTRSIDPQDFIFLFATRSSNPGVSYQFNFNRVPDLRTVVQTFGLKTIPKILRIMAKGLWGRDYSHRQAQ